MAELTEFEREYFVQTRKEIDTEKRERDQLLNFAVIVLGALGFAVVQSEKAMEFLKQPHSLMFEVSTLVILTSLFWVRRKKLQQIADRWYTLYRMEVKRLGKQRADQLMEAVVIRGFEKARYIRKDVVLNIALSLPIYTLLFVSAFGLTLPAIICILIPALIVAVHASFSFALLATKMRDPFPTLVSKIQEDIVEHVAETDNI